MDLFKQLQYIEEHFKNITKEELHHNLLESGFGQIKPSSYSDMKLISKAEMKRHLNKNNYIYAIKSKNYKFNNGFTVYNNESNLYKSPILKDEVVA